MEERAQLANGAYVDRVRAVDTDKVGGIEARYQPRQRFLVQIRAIGPEADIVVFGLEPNNLSHRHDDDAVPKLRAIHRRRHAVSF